MCKANALADFSMSMDDNVAWSDKLRGPEDDFDYKTRKPRVGTPSYESWVSLLVLFYISSF